MSHYLVCSPDRPSSRIISIPSVLFRFTKFHLSESFISNLFINLFIYSSLLIVYFFINVLVYHRLLFYLSISLFSHLIIQYISSFLSIYLFNFQISQLPHRFAGFERGRFFFLLPNTNFTSIPVTSELSKLSFFMSAP